VIIAVEFWDVTSSRHSPAATAEKYSSDIWHKSVSVSHDKLARHIFHYWSGTVSPADREIHGAV